MTRTKTHTYLLQLTYFDRISMAYVNVYDNIITYVKQCFSFCLKAYTGAYFYLSLRISTGSRIRDTQGDNGKYICKRFSIT